MKHLISQEHLELFKEEKEQFDALIKSNADNVEKVSFQEYLIWMQARQGQELVTILKDMSTEK